MALIRDRIGDRYNDYLYGVQDSVYKYAKQLDESGYIPNENDGLIDSLQSGLWSGAGGLLGGLSGFAKEHGWDGVADWSQNEAKYAGNRAQANAYTGKWEEGNYLNYALNQSAQALGSSVPSLIGDIAVSAAIGSAIGPEGTALGAVAGFGKWAYRLKEIYDASKLVQYGAKMGKFTVGVVAGGAVENAINAGDTYMTGLSRGMDHNQAYDAMKTTFNEGWAPAMANYAFDKISMKGSLGSGIAGAFAGEGGKVLAKGAVATAINAGAGIVGESLTEAWQQQIQEQALGTPEYKNVNIYDPRTWTQDMKDQAFDAGIGSAPLGLISGAFGSGKSLSQKESVKNNEKALAEASKAITNTSGLDVGAQQTEGADVSSPVVAPNESDNTGVVDTGIDTVSATVPTVTTERSAVEPMDLGEVTPDNMTERPKDQLDDVLDNLSPHYTQNLGKTEEEIEGMKVQARDYLTSVHDAWENETPDAKYTRKDFEGGYKDIGYTNKDARALAKATVDMYNQKKEAPQDTTVAQEPAPSLLERADSIGYNLSDDTREALEKGTLPESIVNNIEKNIGIKEREYKENQKRREYDATYKDSRNVHFLGYLFSEVEDENKREQLKKDIRYAIREATREHQKETQEYQEGKRDKVPVSLATRLKRRGINDKNQDMPKGHAKAIIDHVKKMEKVKEKIDNPTKELMVDMGYFNAIEHTINRDIQADADDLGLDLKSKEKTKAHEEFYDEAADYLIGKAEKIGFPVEQTQLYKDIKKNYPKAYKKIIDRLGDVENKKGTLSEIIDFVYNGKIPNNTKVVGKKSENKQSKKEESGQQKSQQEQQLTSVDNNKNEGKLTKKRKKQLKQAENERKLQEAKARLAEEENKKSNKPQKDETITDEDLAEIQREQEEDREIEQYENKQKESNENDKEVDDDWIRQAEEDAQKEKETREAFEERKNNEERTSEEVDKELEEDEESEEFFRNNKEKEDNTVALTDGKTKAKKQPVKHSGKPEDAHKVFDKYLSGEIDANTAKVELMAHENKASKKHAKYIQSLKDSIDYYEEKDEKSREKAKADASNKNKIQSSLVGIDKFIKSLTKDLEEGKLDNKAYEDRVKSIKKRIKDMFIKHPETLKEYSDLESYIPKTKPVTKDTLINQVEDGSVKLTNSIIKSLLVRPGELKTSLTKWVRNKLNDKNVNLNKQDINKVIVKIMEDEYEAIVDKYGSLDDALKDKDGNHRVRVFFRAVAGLFPDEHFHPTMAQHQERRRVALGLSKQGLDPSSKKGDLLKYKDLAKTYFREEFDPKNKDMEFVNATNVASQQKSKKLDLKKNKNIKPAITLKSVEDLGDDSFKFTLEYDKSKGWTPDQIKKDYANIVAPYTDNMFISDEVNNVEVNEDNGTITFEAEPLLSERKFSGELESDTNTDDRKTALQGRMMVVEAAIETSPDKVISLSVDKKHEPVVQKYLDNAFGKGKYKIIDSGESTSYVAYDGTEDKQKDIREFYIYSLEKYPTEESLKKAMENDSFYYPIYQKGNDVNESNESKSDISVIKKLANNSQVNQDKPSEAEMKQILGGIEKAFGEHSKDVLDFLNKVEGLSIRVFDGEDPSRFDMNTGELFIRRDRLGGTATAHELVHVAVESYLTNTDGKNKLIKILEDTTNSLEEELYGNDRLETTNQIGSGTRGMSEGNLRGNDQLRNVGDNTRTQTQSDTSGVLDENSNTKGMSSESGEGRRGDSGSLGRSEVQTTSQHSRDNSVSQKDASKETASERKRDGLLRAWDSAKRELEEISSIEGNKQIGALQTKQLELLDRIQEIINDEEADVNEKTNDLLVNFWLANELGKRFNVNMLGAIYKGKDTTNLHETLAYGLQNGLAPVHAGALFNGAKEHASQLSYNIKESIDKNYGHTYGVFAHTTTAGIMLDNLKRGYGISVSMAGNTVENSINDSSRGAIRAITDPQTTQDISEINGGNDVSSSSTFDENQDNDKYGGRLVTRRDNAFAAVTSVLANHLNSLEDVKKSLYGREGNAKEVKEFAAKTYQKLINLALKILDGRNNTKEYNEIIEATKVKGEVINVIDRLYGPNGTLEPVIEALHESQESEISVQETEKGKTSFSKEELDRIEELRKWVKDNLVIPYTEHRASTFPVKNIHVLVVTQRGQQLLKALEHPELLTEKEYKEAKEEVDGMDELIELAKKQGKEVWYEPLGVQGKSLSNWMVEKVREYNKKNERKISFQKGTEQIQKQPTEAEQQAQKEEQEAKEQPIVAAGKKLAKEVGKRIGSQTPDNVQIITRDERSGNITAWGLKKWFASPIRMIQKFIPQAKAMVRWAEDAENHQTKLMTGYYKLFDKMKKAIGDKVDEFKKLTGEINSLGRDFIQTVAVNHTGKEYYVNLTDNDIFEEYMDEASAKERYKELKNDGHKVFMDFKENKWRVLASADSLKVLPSYRQAKELARTQTIERIKEKGYSNEVANAYNHWITLRERIYRDKVEAWKESGQPEEQRPKLLWGYTPSLHGKYGFYKVRVVRDDNGKTYSHYDKIASFKTQKDAMKYASQFEDDGNSYAIVEHGSRFDDARTASAIYEDSYDPSYDTILEELESPEDINQRFERISHSYPMIAKIIDEYISKGKGLNREQFISLLEDKEKLEDLGIDKAQLEEERKHANLDELFRLKPTVGKLDIQKHLLINYGNHMRDKFNQTRMNAKGANPDVLGNMEDYIRYNARYIPTSVFYYKSTALYRDITGRDYKSQFGRGGEGAQNDYQEILNNFIGSVVGLPNGADRTLNNIFNGVFGKPWVRAMFGDRAVTDALGFGMQAVTVLKLGMFRPTAAIAQLGTLMNVTTYSGFNGLTAQAMKDAALTGGNTTMSEKKMFNKIGLNREDTALETQALMNDKSIYNMTIKGLPIGKFLEKSMFMFNATDKYTRRVAALVAYRKAISEGKTDAEAVEEAREFVRKTNFDYSDKDAPQIFTRFGSIGKLLLQFRKYPVKEMEFIVDLFKSGDKKAITRFFGQYLVMAGMMGIPVAGAGDELAEWITGTSPTREMKKIMMEWAGNDATKKSFALVAMYGAPALAGVDFSRNIGIGDIVPTNGIEGPTLSTIANVYKAFRDHEGANNIMSNVAKELSPAYANYYQALTGRKRDWNKDVDGRNYSTGERIVKGLGFRPVSDSVEYDTSNIIKEKQDAEKAKKQKLINKYLDDPKSVTKKELHQAGIKGADIKRAQENLKKTKTEKALSNMPKKKQTEAKQTALSLAEFEEDL